MPTARTVTVAKIASPYSNDRTYQEFFLQALKAYFMSTKRLLKKGDLIAIPLDTEFAGLAERRRTQENDIQGGLAYVDVSNRLVIFNHKMEPLKRQSDSARRKLCFSKLQM